MSDEKRQDFDRWRHDPITQEFLADVEAGIITCSMQMVNGQTLGQSSEDTVKKTARQVGVAEGLNKLLNWIPKGC